MRLRTTYPGFVNAVNLYFDKLIPTVKPLMVNPDPFLIFPLKKAADHFSEWVLFLSLKKEARSLLYKSRTSMDPTLKMRNICLLLGM